MLDYTTLRAKLAGDKPLADALARLNEKRSVTERRAAPCTVEIFADLAAHYAIEPQSSANESYKKMDDRRGEIVQLLEKAARLADADDWLSILEDTPHGTLADRLRTEANTLRNMQELPDAFQWHTPTGRTADARRRAVYFCRRILNQFGLADKRGANTVTASFVSLVTPMQMTPQQIAEID